MDKPGSAGEFPSGRGSAELEKALRQIATAKSWNAAEPLPTTREMGEHFGISNATACRLLIRLSDEGVIWRRDNGRYYLNDSRRLVELHKPYACLLRRLQNWSRVYQAVMGGFSQAFGRDPTSMLFVHNETLVRHADTAHPPVHATAAEQRSSLAEFFQIHRSGFRGILLDEVWDDRVLAEYATELTNAVIVCRPTSIAGLSSVSADFEAGALLAIGHLYARGFDEIWIAVPYADSVAIENLRDAATRAATMLGAGIAEQNVCPVASPDDRERFIARLKSARRRIGVFCLEDNIALILRQAITAAGIECPANVGLLSGMGTDLVTERRISSLRIDYEAIGRTAGEIITSGRVQQITLRPLLVPGETT
ncbi:substrate-binding domain-containing protein [Opitutus sp. ER46]|uniref:substrate-binding domain-containing protein n=1 Tax=Opitutus sp. ER46 TaxID=2161864 RepID=UPI001E374D66|nr:substrate-binding domain-containing protein [Opitutus sp. ER46]